MSHLQQFERLLDIRTVGFEGWVRLPQKLHSCTTWGTLHVLRTEILCWLADGAGLAAISMKNDPPFQCNYMYTVHQKDNVIYWYYSTIVLGQNSTMHTSSTRVLVLVPPMPTKIHLTRNFPRFGSLYFVPGSSTVYSTLHMSNSGVLRVLQYATISLLLTVQTE